MESDRAPERRSDAAAFRELTGLVHHLMDELAMFRRRALQAEAKLRGYEEAATPAPSGGGKHKEMERENAELRRRLATATELTQQMLDRVRFLRQQAPVAGER